MSFTCPVCFEEFNKESGKIPKILKCGDTLCSKCLKNLYKIIKICCPLCQIKIDEDLIDIPNNKYVISMVINKLNSGMSNINNCDYKFSIGLMGDSSAGKTCIANYFYKGKIIVGSLSSIGIEHQSKDIKINKNIVRITLWDTAGQEKYNSIPTATLKKIQALLLVFSLTCTYDKAENCKKLVGKAKDEFINKCTKSLFDNLANIIKQFEDNNSNKERLIYLIGNKADDVENRIIRDEDAENFAKENNLQYYETSAYTGKNIDKVFDNLATDLIQIYPEKYETKGTKLKSNKSKKKSCCSSKKSKGNISDKN